MCIIIVKKHHKKLNSEIAMKAICYNPDGFGIQFLDTGEIVRTMDKSLAYSLLLSARPFVAHARLNTVGDTNLSNTHPFKIDKYNTLFHNGTVNVPEIWGNHKTDSEYVATVLKDIPWKSWKPILSMSKSRFAYVRTSKTGKLYVNRTGTWLEKDSVFYSKQNIIEDTTTIAVYGTLRKGYNNHSLLPYNSFLASGTTEEHYRMSCLGIPYVHSKPHNQGKSIKVELYAIKTTDLQRIDSLEGHPTWYKRKPITVNLSNGISVTAELYFNDKHKPTPPFYADYGTYLQAERKLAYIKKSKSLVNGTLLNSSYLYKEKEEIEQTFNTTPDEEQDLVWDSLEQRWFDMTSCRYLNEDPKPIDPTQHELF